MRVKRKMRAERRTKWKDRMEKMRESAQGMKKKEIEMAKKKNAGNEGQQWISMEKGVAMVLHQRYPQ